MTDLIAVTHAGPIATVVLDRPDKLNAMTKTMWQALGNVVGALSDDDTVRCIILRGAGEKAFSPGNDIAEFATARSNKAQAIDYGKVMHATAETLAACRHPLVAQIHGICVGGGLEIAALCDLRICGTSSRFGAPINKLGLVMAYAEMAPLVRLVGPHVALEILLEGRVFDATEAKEKGLVTRVVPDADVAMEAQATAQRIADGAPLAARWHKKFARRLGDPRPMTDAERDECFDCFDTEDFRTGLCGVPRQAEADIPRPMTTTAPTPHAPGAAMPTAGPSESMPALPRTGPLAGMRVLELAQIMAGPTCGIMLADLGADVIKVEKLPGGDDARGYREPRVNGVSAPFMMLNRGKRGIAIDLKQLQGREILLRLVRDADVLVENFRRDTLDKLGLGYDVLAAANPALIYCAVTGFGRDGPLADKGGFDLVAQGFAGLMSITGEPGRPPAKTGNPVSDINAGILAALGVLAAYTHRLKTGRGQIVDTSLFEAALQQSYWHASSYFATGQSPGPLGSAHLLTAPYQAFAASDGYLNIGGANQSNWERIADVLGHAEWRDDPRFATNTARMEHRETLVTLMNDVLGTRTRAEWMAKLDAAGVPAGPVHTLGEALTHPQTLARGMVVDLVHPHAGATKAIGCPVHFSATPASVERPAPLLGEHTRTILRESGYSDLEIDAFVAAGVVGIDSTAIGR